MMTLSDTESVAGLEKFRVSWNVSISSESGRGGHLNIMHSTPPIDLDAVDMAEVLVKVRSFIQDLVIEYGTA